MSAAPQTTAGSPQRILVWLPSPMGDAILATPALRAIRRRFDADEIFFIGGPVVRAVLSPTSFADRWCPDKASSPLKTASKLREFGFSQAILMANSFSSALAVYLAGIPVRIGYARGGRGLLLTERLAPPTIAASTSADSPAAGPIRSRIAAAFNRFAQASMVDYYLALASWTGADTEDRHLELSVDPDAGAEVDKKLPGLAGSSRPLVILVPGGAFGPSKCWLPERYAKTADRLIDKYGAEVVVSVASNDMEKAIAERICSEACNKLTNLAQCPLTLAELKALFARAAVVITNDTGPRHIAIALQRKLVTIFGPNDPAWTETDYPGETKIVADVECAPCAKPNCPKPEHICMLSISVDTVFEAACRYLDKTADGSDNG